MEDYSMKEFVAFSRKLLRDLKTLKKYLDENRLDDAKELINALIEETERDIEA